MQLLKKSIDLNQVPGKPNPKKAVGDLLETILFSRDNFMLPETVVCFLKQLYASRNSCMLLETVVCFQKQSVVFQKHVRLPDKMIL